MDWNIRLYIIYTQECDPKKCTGKKLIRFGLARAIPIYKIRRNCIFLNPYSDTIISRSDREIVLKHGILTLDCSWNNADEERFRSIEYRTKANSRALPYLIACNPVNFGKPYKLSSAEAFASSLYITGFEEVAKHLISKFSWGGRFFEVNSAPILAYALAENSEEVLLREKEFV